MGNSVSQSEQFKSKLIEVLKFCITFFDKHNLRWFIACGSAIGAIRHKGIIPWDDDIDIYMPRSDYKKLMTLNSELLEEGYRFLCFEKDDGYPLAFGKVMDNNTTLWSKRRFPFNYGIYVDIFPLDLVNLGMMPFGNRWMKYRNLLLKYRAKVAEISISGFLEDFRAGKNDFLRTFAAKLSLVFTSKEKIKKELISIQENISSDTGDRYVSLTEIGMYMFPRKWFDEYVIVPFEDTYVRVSKYYDEYLTYIYGDYMTPPPPEKRKGEGPHDKLYINFERNVPLKEVKKLIRTKSK